MKHIHFTPEEYDAGVDMVLLNYQDQVLGHLPCICKRKQHKNCPRHLAKGVMKMVYEQRQPLGDKLIYLQAGKDVLQPNERARQYPLTPDQAFPTYNPNANVDWDALDKKLEQQPENTKWIGH